MCVCVCVCVCHCLFDSSSRRHGVKFFVNEAHENGKEYSRADVRAVCKRQGEMHESRGRFFWANGSFCRFLVFVVTYFWSPTLNVCGNSKQGCGVVHFSLSLSPHPLSLSHTHRVACLMHAPIHTRHTTTQDTPTPICFFTKDVKQKGSCSKTHDDSL